MYYENEEISSFLSMTYNPRIKYPDVDIICNDILNDDNVKIFENEKLNWKYNGENFSYGSQNKKIFPSLMHYLILATFKNKHFVTLKEYEECVTKKYRCVSHPSPYTERQILSGRSYQTYTSFLREIDFVDKVLKINPNCKVYKNPHLDLCEGIDFIIELNGKRKYIAIKHEGRNSDKYDMLWKNKKEDQSQYKIERVTAKHNSNYKLEFISCEDIKVILNDF